LSSKPIETFSGCNLKESGSISTGAIMNLVKYAFKNLQSDKANVLLFISQIVVALLLIDFSLNFYASASKGLERSEYVVQSIPRGFNYFEVNEFELQKQIESKEYYPRRVEEIFNFLTTHKDFNTISCIDRSGISLEGFPELPPDAIDYIHVYSLDKSWFSYFTFPKLTTGRRLTIEDFTTSQPIPIVLGSSFKGILQVGDRISSLGIFYDQFEVIGFFDQGTEIYIDKQVQITDEIAVYPLGDFSATKEILEQKNIPPKWFFEFAILNSTIVPQPSLVDVEKLKAEIRQEFEKDGFFKLQFNDITESFERDGRQYRIMADRIRFIALMISAFALLSILMVQIWRISQRRKSFGIFILSGATRSQLGASFFIENLISFSTALLLFNIFRIVIYKPQFYFIELILASLFLPMLLTFFPYLALISKDLIYYIKRDE
jgi:hypothetical protein